MEGTWINAVTVILASGIGLLLNKRLPDRYHQIVFQAIGLFTIVLGIKMAFDSQNLLYVILSLAFGGLIGEFLRIEDRIRYFSDWLKHKLKVGNPKFTEGFTTATLLFCVGTMSILGAIQDGLGETPDLLYTKSVLDGFSAMVLTVAYGIGVAFSVVPMVLYQGGISLAAGYLDSFLSESMMAELSSVGGVMIVGIGINLLGLKELRILNLLPSLFVVVLLTWAYAKYAYLFV